MQEEERRQENVEGDGQQIINEAMQEEASQEVRRPESFTMERSMREASISSKKRKINKRHGKE